MATIDWLDVDGNLANTANYSGAALPTTDDIFNMRYGNKNITAGLTAITAKLGEWNVMGGFTGSFGNSGAAPVIIGAKKVNFAGGSEVTQNFIKAPSAAVGYDNLIIHRVGANGLGSLSIECHTDANSCKLAVLRFGKIALLAGNFARVVAKPLGGNPTGLSINYQAPTIVALHTLGGIAKMSGAGVITDAWIPGGLLDVQAGTLTRAEIMGGTLSWKTSVTLVRARVFAGLLDASGDARAKTVTELEVHDGARANLNNNGSTIAVTTPVFLPGAVVDLPGFGLSGGIA